MKWDDYFVLGASTFISGGVAGIYSAANRYMPLGWVAVGFCAVAAVAFLIGASEKKRQCKEQAEEAAAFKSRMEQTDEKVV